MCCEDRLRMHLHTLDRVSPVTDTHENARCRVRSCLQLIGQRRRVDDE